jgi:zinc transport system permease protein
MGLAHYLNKVYGLEWATPFLGALVSALLAALLISWLVLYKGQREDGVMGMLWSLGMAVGILFISLTPGYSEDLMSYLFGNVLILSKADLVWLAALDLLVLVVFGLWGRHILAVCFDPVFAKTRGLPVGFYTVLLYILTAISVVSLVNMAGIVLVIAMLTLPVSLAGTFFKRAGFQMIFGAVFNALFMLSGIIAGFYWDLPSGPLAILFVSFAYALSLLVFKQNRS